MTITGTGPNGAPVHAATLMLTVKAPAPDFTISATPASLNVSRGSSGAYTVTIGAVNGTSSVNLSVSGLPAHTTAAFSVNPVNGSGTSKLTITVGRRTAPGAFKLTISGANGSFNHSTPVTLNVN